MITNVVRTKILFLLSNFKSGGAETQFWNLVNGLDRNKFEIHVIQIESKGRKAVIHKLENTTIKIVAARFQFDPLTIFEIVRYIKSHHIQLIQSLLFMDNQFARVAGKLAGIPVITSVRGELKPILGVIKTRLEIAMQRFSTRVIVNSNWLKSDLVRQGANAEKITVIYNGLSSTGLNCTTDIQLKQRFNIPENGLVIGIVARLHPMKDHETFIKTIKTLSQKRDDIYALIIGGGNEKENIECLIASLGLENSVFFAGEITENIGCWYQSLDLLMLTSQWGESFPNVILEAMACQTPVVATDVSAVCEIIDTGINGFIAPIKDAAKLAEYTLDVLSSPERQKKFIENGLSTVEGLKKDRMVNSYDQLYTDILR